MFSITDGTNPTNGADEMSSFREKIIKFFYTKIMGHSPEFYKFMRSLGGRQDNEQLSDDDIVIDEPYEEWNETDVREAKNTCVSSY